jgi:hypothetical protein
VNSTFILNLQGRLSDVMHFVEAYKCVQTPSIRSPLFEADLPFGKVRCLWASRLRQPILVRGDIFRRNNYMAVRRVDGFFC